MNRFISNKRITYFKRVLIVYLFLSPAILYFITIRFYPFFSAIKWSLFKWNPINPAKNTFIGLDNYIRFFTKDPKTGLVFLNTAEYIIIFLPLVIILSLILATILNNIRYKNMFRTAYFIPVVAPMVVVAALWRTFLHPAYGAVFPLLNLIGIPNKALLDTTATALPTIALVAVWKLLGFYAVIFLAGLQNIPDTYYEAARIDGASKVKMFFQITIPLLRPIIMFVLITGFINSFQVFDQVYVMSGGSFAEVGAPGNSTLVYMLYLYSQGFRFMKMGYAAMMGVIMFLITFVFSMISLRFNKTYEM